MPIEPTMTFAIGAACSVIDWPEASSEVRVCARGSRENTRFQLGTAARMYYLFCDTPEAALAWVTKIRALSQSASQGAAVRQARFH